MTLLQEWLWSLANHNRFVGKLFRIYYENNLHRYNRAFASLVFYTAIAAIFGIFWIFVGLCVVAAIVIPCIIALMEKYDRFLFEHEESPDSLFQSVNIWNEAVLNNKCWIRFLEFNLGRKEGLLLYVPGFFAIELILVAVVVIGTIDHFKEHQE